MAHGTLSDSFVGTDVEASAPTKIVEVATFYRLSNSARSRRAYQAKMDAAVAEAYRLLAPKPVVTSDGYEAFMCAGCGRKAHRKVGLNRTHCRPCERGK